MRRLLTVIQSLFLLDIIVFAMVFPFAWTLRDGLGPNAVTSHGFFAVKRALMAFLVWVLPVSAIWLHSVEMLLSRRIAKKATWQLSDPTCTQVVVCFVIAALVSVVIVFLVLK